MNEGAIVSMTTIGTEFTRRQYRGLVYSIVALAVLGLLSGMALDQQVVGTSTYLDGVWIGGGIAVLAPRLSEATFQDERDHELHNRASGLLLSITMVLGLSVIPTLYVLGAGGYYEITGEASGVILTLSGLFLLYGVCLVIAKRRI